MADMISGGERRPGRWLVAAVVLVLAVGALVYLRHGHGADHARPVATPTDSPPPPTLPRLHEKTGITLYVSNYPGPDGETLRRLDLDTGRITSIAGLPRRVLAKLEVLPVRGGVAVIGPRCSRCSYTRGSLVYLVRDAYVVRHSRVVSRFPASGQALPGRTDRTLWIWADADSSIQEVDLAGRAVSPRYRIPAGFAPIGAAADGILISAAREVALWNPATGARRRLGQYIAAAGDVYVWTSAGCRRDCPAHVTDLVRGTTRILPGQLPVNSYATMSADGTKLALTFTDSADIAYVEVVDLRTGVMRDLGGISLADLGLSWSADSRWLIISGMHGLSQLRNTVAVWRPGMDRPAIARNVPVDQIVLG